MLYLACALACPAPALLCSHRPPTATRTYVHRRVIKDSRTISESHYHIYKRYFGFLCYNALFVFIVTVSIFETVRARVAY